MAKRKKGLSTADDGSFQMALPLIYDEIAEYENVQTKIILKAVGRMTEGIFLVPPPTGSGKSHGVVHAIIRMWLNGMRVWFITARKNNLSEPIDNLLREADKMHENGDLTKKEYNDLKKSVLPLKNYIEAWEPFLSKKMGKSLRECKLRAKDYKLFDSYYNKLKKEWEKYKKNVYPEEADFRTKAVYDAEREMRLFVKNELREYAKNYSENGTKKINGGYSQEIIDAFISDNKWVADVYPFININKTRLGRYPIVFATEAKKNSQCDNMMGDSSYLYNHIRSLGGIVVIDEIDQSKVSCRDQLLTTQVHNNFKVALLIKLNFTKERLQAVIDKERDPEKKRKMLERLETSRKLLESYEKRFGELTTLREFSQKCLDSVSSKRHIIMEVPYNRFTNDNLTFESRGASTFIDLITNEEFKRAKDSDELKEKAWTWLKDASSGLSGYITHFISSAPYFLEPLKLKRNHPYDSAYERSNIASYLHMLNIENGSEFDYISDRLIKKGSVERGIMPAVSSIYSNGMSISIPSLKDWDSERNTIDTLNIDITPEEILATIADKCLVIGLSATADLDSVIGNYNYDWIRSCNIPVCLPDDEDEDLINEVQLGRFKNIESVDFQTFAVTLGSALSQLPEDIIIGCNRLAEMFTDKDKDPKYENKRLLKIVQAFSVYSENKQTMGFALTQKDYGKKLSDGSDARQVLFLDILHAIDPSVNILFANAETLETIWSEIMSLLSKGERVFLFATSQGAGTGQNLNYPLDMSEGRYVQVADEKRTYPGQVKVDIDFMYLPDITNTFPSQDLKKDFKMEVLVEQLYIIEELYQKGEISNSQRGDLIYQCMSRGFISAAEQKKWPSYQAAVLSILIQLTGRGERSPYKRPKVFYLYDEDLADRLCSDYVSQYLLRKKNINPHTRMLLEDIAARATSIGSANDRTEIYLSNRATEVLNHINRDYGEIGTGNIWYLKKIIRYEALRLFVLMHPIAKEADFEGEFSWIKPFYLKTDNAYYRFDLSNIEIRLSEKKGFRRISSEATNLDTLMLVPQIRSYFEKHGYETEWGEGEYVMSPGLMINIYMGALGEEALKALLANCSIESIRNENIYEMYDFVCDHMPIDAKNLTPEAYPAGAAPAGYNADKHLRNIAFKLDRTDASAAIYVNMIDDGDRRGCETKAIRGDLLREGHDWERPVLFVRGLVTREGIVLHERLVRIAEFIGEHPDAIANYGYTDEEGER